jgi:transposase
MKNDSSITLEASLGIIESLQKEVANLKEQLAWFQKQVFGKRSEKIMESSPFQPTLFDLPSAPEPAKEISIPKHIRRSFDDNTKNPTKISFPDDLPVERVVIDLKEDEKICSITGKPLIKIGEEISQKIARKPASFYIKEIIRPKYAAPKGAEEAIFIASLPESLLPRCKADESFLADIIVKKFADHLPLYRQSEILGRQGIQISRQIMSQWLVKCASALKPLYEKMKSTILNSNNIFIDEVPVDMLKLGKGKVAQTYMWVIVGGLDKNPCNRVYNFRLDRTHKNAEELLKNCSKETVVHSDKYGAYEALANQKCFTWCPCWAHIRRKFLDGICGDPDFVNLVIRKIKYLFMFERIAWTHSEEERLRIREKHEIPIIDELILLAKNRLYKGNALPQSKFKEALGYFLGLVPYLKNYTTSSWARIDNNVAERAVRPLAIGRKNWLFLGSEEGGEAAAILLSLVQTCRALKINPYEYLKDIMSRIMSHPFQKIDELLPENWIKSKSTIQ